MDKFLVFHRVDRVKESKYLKKYGEYVKNGCSRKGVENSDTPIVSHRITQSQLCIVYAKNFGIKRKSKTDFQHPLKS